MKYAIEVSINNNFMGFFNKYHLGQVKREQTFYDLDNSEIKQEIVERIFDTLQSFPSQKVSFAFVEETENEDKEEDTFEEDFESDDDF